ncbi:EamA family transporter [Halomonas litopenaei]|uniref:EamA family transporter n=2 Tax=Halomonadaceae TaxID=28256 RepID=A0ABX5IY03_9GAMM|nr:EamA family transporter [Halomonas sp. SYSU XM8]PTL93600.1 EamA family transporter [Halomonas litopenaei]
MTDRTRLAASAYLAFIALGVIWGSNFVFMKWASEWITSSQVALLRVGFGFLPILIVGLVTRSLHWSHLRHLHHFVVMALLATVIYYVAFAQGTALLLSSLAGMLSGAIPLFTFVAAWLFLRSEPLNPRSIGGTLLGFFGILLIASPWGMSVNEVSPAGVGYMVLGSASVGLSFVYARRFVSPLGLPPLALATYQTGLALLVLLLGVDLGGVSTLFDHPRAAWAMAVGLGLLGTGVAYVLYYFIVDRLGAVVASGVTYLPPVVALMIGVLLVGEPVRALDLVAMVAILAGVGLLQSGRRQ